jgi:hypothetical protein
MGFAVLTPSYELLLLARFDRSLRYRNTSELRAKRK